MRIVGLGLGFFSIVLVHGESLAAETSYLVEPGIVVSVGLVGRHGFSLGPSVSYVAFDRKSPCACGYGAYARLELGSMHPPEQDWSFLLRPSAGIQGSALFAGSEFGVSFSEGGGGEPRVGADVTPFFSAALLWSGFRFTFPGTAPDAVMDGDLVFGLQAPILVGGPAPIQFGSGRPCRVGLRTTSAEAITAADAVVASVQSDADARWRADICPSLDGLDTEQRAELAETWLRDALAEHASIAAFSSLSLDLLSLGAPPDLVAACHRAALDETEHARLCFALASAYAGRPLGPGPFPGLSRTRTPPTFASVAAESLVDGWLGEGAAAAHAEEHARTATDPVLRDVWSRIARDEARHAELGRRIVEWCRSSAQLDIADYHYCEK
jgi:hypothetical protein